MVGGGALSLSGPVSMTAPYPADLVVEVAGARLRDPRLYETTVGGRLTITGALMGGATIAGRLSLGETSVQVPAAGFGTAASLPELTHIGAPAAVQATRARAGLMGEDAAHQSGMRPYRLDITLDAPRRIFMRGRGLDAELGGSLRLQGTTDAIVPAGQFDLVRGRLDILGKRFTLGRGLVQLQGDFTPFISFAASTAVDGATATIGIEGVATAPAIWFTSAPEMPEEEVLALLLFGRGLSTLSPFQAAQLASAVATLAGRGGEGIVSRLRRGFGLDDLDITTGDEGVAALRAGKYITEKVYTDVTIGADGTSEINLNLDVSPSLTLRGSVGTGTGVGIYFEKDY